METFLYSVLHMLVDGLCALSMFAVFRNHEHWYLYLLIYNFAAFVLQIVFGTIMDIMKALQMNDRIGKANLPAACTILGVIITCLGAFLHPAILGIGNALFHIGGGIGTIEEDRRKNLRGQALGIFVAPGALGLYLGGVLGKQIPASCFPLYAMILAVVMMILCVWLTVSVRKNHSDTEMAKAKPNTQADTVSGNPGLLLAITLCFIVVILRSFVGFYGVMEWKNGFTMGLLATIAVVSGKMLGGILSARFGILKVSLVSLLLAAIGYLFGSNIFFGLSALLFFNMTMPITLYLITEQLPDMQGFSFGLLTVALFLGWLPSWYQISIGISGTVIGALGSILTLILLAFWGRGYNSPIIFTNCSQN